MNDGLSFTFIRELIPYSSIHLFFSHLVISLSLWLTFLSFQVVKATELTRHKDGRKRDKVVDGKDRMKGEKGLVSTSYHTLPHSLCSYLLSLAFVPIHSFPSPSWLRPEWDDMEQRMNWRTERKGRYMWVRNGRVRNGKEGNGNRKLSKIISSLFYNLLFPLSCLTNYYSPTHSLLCVLALPVLSLSLPFPVHRWRREGERSIAFHLFLFFYVTFILSISFLSLYLWYFGGF